MRVGKVCHACEGEPSEFSCMKCGRLVGKKCWKGSMCKDCSKGVMGQAGTV